MNHLKQYNWQALGSDFERDGFVVLRDLVPTKNFPELLERCEGLFHGNFETGVYPDEWHFRHGMTYPSKTKEIVNAWKCDREIARLVMNSSLGESVSKLLKWPSVRIAQDDVILKPPGGSAVGLHQDSTYISQNFQLARPIVGPLSVTVWIPLEPVDEQNGTLLFGRGSHKWPLSKLKLNTSFHTDESFHSQAAFSHLVGESSSLNVDICAMRLRPGDVSVHHENMWHCSDKNASKSRHRRVIAVHLLRGDVLFQDNTTYIYGRYKLWNDFSLREEFFPTIFPPSPFTLYHLGLSSSTSKL
jgi:phytanoyl-CoA hydroxylase